jgi:uncharacterized membrane protein YeaQ/YmgE (transglycosylase-associated protein family)
MSLLNILILLLVAAVCGSIGQALVGYSVGGCLMSTIVGFIGAWVGSWLSVQLGLPEPFMISVGGESFPILWSIIGSALFVAILGLFTRRRVVV